MKSIFVTGGAGFIGSHTCLLLLEKGLTLFILDSFVTSSKKSLEKVSLILNEAMSQETGLLIPYNACVELQDDTNLRYARFIETENFIHIFLHDENDRYLSEIYCKGENEFRYWLVNRKQIFDEPENLKKMFLYFPFIVMI